MKPHSRFILFGAAVTCLATGLSVLPVWGNGRPARANAGQAVFPKYTIVDLGTLPGGTSSYAAQVNAAGQVVGHADNEDSASRAFLWQNGTMKDLGALAGNLSCAFAINDQGHIVGFTNAQEGDKLPTGEIVVGIHPFLWKSGKMTDIQHSKPDQVSWSAYAVNNRGQVAGTATIQFGGTHAVIWQNGKFTDLGGEQATAFAINDSGQVAGEARWPDGQAQRAFLASPGRPMRDLGALGTAVMSTALGINNKGEVVGWSLTSDPKVTNESKSHAFLWRSGKMIDLGTLGGENSSASAINDKGQVVGVSEDKEGTYRGFLWQDGKMVPLDSLLPADSGWQMSPPQESPYSLAHVSINQRGQIVGCASHEGRLHAFLMTPN
jgi:probable HAF family extracellular repeat protein